MAIIYVDNKPYEVKDGQNLLQACLSLGFNIPYFCWHPALGSVGACRQCAVKQFKDEKDTQGRIVMSCMTPATDGTRISIDDPEVKAFRATVIEWLMINHPHDCPICDEGGECHLQDMTVMTGHAVRRYRFKKRTYRNQYLGPLINHEMNRCIQCYRCVRFYRDYAGGRDFDVFAAHDHLYFGRHEEGILQSEFSGNLVEVCPTGVFTDKAFKKHFTRKWDLQTAPSICVQCGLGCNTIPGERYGKLRRIRNRFNFDVNGYFLCDRGRYGYEFVNSDGRIRQPLLRTDKGASAQPVSKDTALQHLASLLAGKKKAIGIGSPRASIEANFALRALVGADNFYAGLGEQQLRLLSTIIEILRDGPAPSASLQDVRQADAVFILGEDVTNTAPLLDLAVKQSIRQPPTEKLAKLGIAGWDDAAMRHVVQDEKGPLFIATPFGTKLDSLARQVFRAAPDDLARLGFAVAQLIDSNAPKVTELPNAVRALANKIAQALRVAKRPVIIAGCSNGNDSVLQAAANIGWALCKQAQPAKLCLTVPECNSLGLALMAKQSMDAVMKKVAEGDTDAVIILENDLYLRAEKTDVQRLMDTAEHVIVIDHSANKTIADAELILPAATFAEAAGTLVNNEGRAQRFYQVFKPEGHVQESWLWLREAMLRAGHNKADSWQSLDKIVESLADELPVFEPVLRIAPPSELRMLGQRVPRQPHRYSGRTAMNAHKTMHEPKPAEDPNSPLAFSMEGYPLQPPAPLLSNIWAPGWNSVQALNKFQAEVGGPIRNGEMGKRLFDPGTQGNGYFTGVPSSFKQKPKEWLLMPIYHIFGSEELSVHSPAIAELAPKPYLALHPDDASSLQIAEGEMAELSCDSFSLRLPVKIMPESVNGIAGLPVGLTEWTGLELPRWVKIS